MKIGIVESLFYSWLRHVKECQVVQTNWKVSPQWPFQHEEEIARFMRESEAYFYQKHRYRIYKQTSLAQLVQRGECDVFGLAIHENKQMDAYAVDVAFHEGGLSYGNEGETAARIIEKCLQSAMCLYGYLDPKRADIIFASPKVNPAELKALGSCLREAEELLRRHGLSYSVRLIANEDFEELVIRPILLASDSVSDPSELFIHGYQMFKLFSPAPAVAAPAQAEQVVLAERPRRARPAQPEPDAAPHPYQELKVGKLANVVLRKLLENGGAPEVEIALMQTTQYSKRFFGLNLPLLVRADTKFDAERYYKQPLDIYGRSYYLCSQWFESPSNNDRPLLLQWIIAHEEKREQ